MFNSNERFILYCESQDDCWNETFSSRTAAIQAGRKAVKAYNLVECYAYRATGYRNVGTYTTVRIWSAPKTKLACRMEAA